MEMSRSFGGSVVTSPPADAQLPSVMDSSPAIIFSVVDLPQPEGPQAR